MIFATSGTTNYPFPRFIQAIDLSLLELDLTERLIIQCPPSDYVFRYSKIEKFPELSFDQMTRYFKSSRLNVIHGGIGSILLALNLGQNLPIVIPRSKSHNEHVDQHQIEFVHYLQKRINLPVVESSMNAILQLKGFLINPQKNTFENLGSHRRSLINKLVNYSDSMAFTNL